MTTQGGGPAACIDRFRPHPGRYPPTEAVQIRAHFGTSEHESVPCRGKMYGAPNSLR